MEKKKGRKRRGAALHPTPLVPGAGDCWWHRSLLVSEVAKFSPSPFLGRKALSSAWSHRSCPLPKFPAWQKLDPFCNVPSVDSWSFQRSPGNLTEAGKTNMESGIYPANPSQTSPLPHQSLADGQSRPAGPHHLLSPDNKTEMELPAKRVGALSLGWSWLRSSGACTV